MLNNHHRPIARNLDTDKLKEKEYNLSGVSVDFADGYVQNIITKDPELLTYFRVLHHKERYEFSSKLLTQSSNPIGSILDIGIAEGVGAHFVQQQLRQNNNVVPAVTGLELDSNTAIQCRKSHPDFTVLQKNVLEFNSKKSFDVVFCFELLGNMSIEDDSILLRKIRELMAPRGMAFISIAVFDESKAGRQKRKDYSARIYNRNSFKALLNSVFPATQTQFFGQIYPLKRMYKEQVGVWANHQNKLPTDFCIAVVKL